MAVVPAASAAAAAAAAAAAVVAVYPLAAPIAAAHPLPAAAAATAPVFFGCHFCSTPFLSFLYFQLFRLPPPVPLLLFLLLLVTFNLLPFLHQILFFLGLLAPFAHPSYVPWSSAFSVAAALAISRSLPCDDGMLPRGTIINDYQADFQRRAWATVDQQSTADVSYAQVEARADREGAPAQSSAISSSETSLSGLASSESSGILPKPQAQQN